MDFKGWVILIVVCIVGSQIFRIYRHYYKLGLQKQMGYHLAKVKNVKVSHKIMGVDGHSGIAIDEESQTICRSWSRCATQAC